MRNRRLAVQHLAAKIAVSSCFQIISFFSDFVLELGARTEAKTLAAEAALLSIREA